MYVTINPRDVPEALKATHAHYYKWIEHKAGASKEKAIDKILPPLLTTSCV